MITIEHLTKRFYSVTALDDVSLRIRQGETVGVLGPNGAGKTTLFRIIAGMLNPDNGTVRPNRDRWPVISFKPDRLLFPNHLRVDEFLTLVCQLANVPPSRHARVVAAVLERVNLGHARRKRIGELSKGMRQRLGLAQAVIGNPDLLLLDEPSNGLDPEGQIEIMQLIQGLHAEGRTVLLSSHQLHEVTATCSHLVILNQGRVQFADSMQAALAMHPTVTIAVDRPIDAVAPLVRALHPRIDIADTTLTLHDDAIALRRQVMTLLLGAGYDIVHVEQRRNSLADVYAQAVRA